MTINYLQLIPLVPLTIWHLRVLRITVASFPLEAAEDNGDSQKGLFLANALIDSKRVQMEHSAFICWGNLIK